MRKPALCHMQTTKAQISLHFHTIWSAPLLFASRIIYCRYLLYRKFQESSYNVVSVAAQAGFESYLVTNPEDRFSLDVAQLFYYQRWEWQRPWSNCEDMHVCLQFSCLHKQVLSWGGRNKCCILLYVHVIPPSSSGSPKILFKIYLFYTQKI